MKIGIIVHSQTGKTHSVAMLLKEKLSAAGHSVSVEQVIPDGEAQPGVKDLKFKTQPEIGKYDALVFGAPVQRFTLSPVFECYLTQLSSLRDKKIALFVTKALPFHWTGGNRAITLMKNTCESKGASICGTGITWSTGKDQEKKAADLVEKLSRLF